LRFSEFTEERSFPAGNEKSSERKNTVPKIAAQRKFKSYGDFEEKVTFHKRRNYAELRVQFMNANLMQPQKKHHAAVFCLFK